MEQALKPNAQNRRIWFYETYSIGIQLRKSYVYFEGKLSTKNPYYVWCFSREEQAWLIESIFDEGQSPRDNQSAFKVAVRLAKHLAADKIWFISRRSGPVLACKYQKSLDENEFVAIPSRS